MTSDRLAYKASKSADASKGAAAKLREGTGKNALASSASPQLKRFGRKFPGDKKGRNSTAADNAHPGQGRRQVPAHKQNQQLKDSLQITQNLKNRAFRRHVRGIGLYGVIDNALIGFP